ncbi:hypothetical protein K7G98_12710 [Saccharothrix sp. MB29]|nr:hypothetical protein [Saccharothrix sp. MB29]
MASGDYENIRHAVEGDDVGVGQVLTALVLLRRLREELAAWEPQLIASARAMGTSWAELAPALGLASRLAAERRYLVRPPEGRHGGGSGARRAGQAGGRPGWAWVRENRLARSLAGQVISGRWCGGRWR